MSKKSLIDRVRVKEPCTQDWETMRGNDQIRFCDHCAKDVNDISSMTKKEAIKLVRRSGGQLCIRYREDPRTGSRLFAPNVSKLIRQSGAAAGVLSASLLLANPVYTQGGAAVVQFERLARSSGGTSSISGIVCDQNGAVIPFAVVSVTNQETSEYFVQNASAEGVYEFKNLAAGKYKLRIEAGGFETTELADMEVIDGIDTKRTIQMEVHKVGATVDVPIDGENYHTVVVGGAMAMTVSEYKSHPLVQAVLNDDIDEVRELLQKKPKVNVRDKSENGITPLHAAVQNGNVEIAALLLSYGAKVNARDTDKRTPLMMIDYDAETEMLDLLLVYGARFDLKDKRKNTLLHYAVKNSAGENVFGRLLILGLDINAANKEGQTPLMLAVEEEDSSLVEMLLAAGANVNAIDKEKRNAWSLTENAAIRELLVSYNARPLE